MSTNIQSLDTFFTAAKGQGKGAQITQPTALGKGSYPGVGVSSSFTSSNTHPQQSKQLTALSDVLNKTQTRQQHQVPQQQQHIQQVNAATKGDLDTAVDKILEAISKTKVSDAQDTRPPPDPRDDIRDLIMSLVKSYCDQHVMPLLDECLKVSKTALATAENASHAIDNIDIEIDGIKKQLASQVTAVQGDDA